MVRRDAGMFDVSHMSVVDLSGARTKDFLRHLLANDIGKLSGAGRAQYSCMLNEDGGVIDDLITYYLGDDGCRMVVNATSGEKDLAWIRKHATAFGVEVRHRDGLAIVAVQGPNAREKAAAALSPELSAAALSLKRFAGVAQVVDEGAGEGEGDWFVGRTGYTGEDGFEIMLPGGEAPALWSRLREAGVAPCGLGARDTLRLEAGMNLYGTDMDESTTPLESGLGWTVAWDPAERGFVGREALEKQRAEGVRRKLVGLVLEDRGVLRGGQGVIVDGEASGVVTSGSFSPTLGKSIGLARVPAGTGGRCHVQVRGRQLAARIVKPPFVRDGQVCEGI